MNVPAYIRNKGATLLRWANGHRIRALIVLIALWIVVEFATLPYWAVHSLKLTDPGETAFMREAKHEAADNGKPIKIVQRWIPLKLISRDAVNAVIVAEDGTFWSHSGFDWFEFRESLERNVKEGRP